VLSSPHPGSAVVMPRCVADQALADRRIELRPSSVGESMPHPRLRGPPASIAGRLRGRVMGITTVAAAPRLKGCQPSLARDRAGPRAGKDTAPTSRLPPSTCHRRKFRDNQRKMCGTEDVLSPLFSVPIVFIKDLGLKFQRVRMIPVPPKKLGRARPNPSRNSRHRAEAALG
jgi:hypothetical protein